MRQASHILTGVVIFILIILTAQGWTGDSVNLFAVFPRDTVRHTLSGFTQALTEAGRMEVTHAIIGMTLVVLSITALVVAFRSGSSKGARIWSITGFLGVVSAAYGGIKSSYQGSKIMGTPPRWVEASSVPTHPIFFCSTLIKGKLEPLACFHQPVIATFHFRSN